MKKKIITILDNRVCIIGKLKCHGAMTALMRMSEADRKMPTQLHRNLYLTKPLKTWGRSILTCKTMKRSFVFQRGLATVCLWSVEESRT